MCLRCCSLCWRWLIFCGVGRFELWFFCCWSSLIAKQKQKFDVSKKTKCLGKIQAALWHSDMKSIEMASQTLNHIFFSRLLFALNKIQHSENSNEQKTRPSTRNSLCSAVCNPPPKKKKPKEPLHGLVQILTPKDSWDSENLFPYNPCMVDLPIHLVDFQC